MKTAILFVVVLSLVFNVAMAFKVEQPVISPIVSRVAGAGVWNVVLNYETEQNGIITIHDSYLLLTVDDQSISIGELCND